MTTVCYRVGLYAAGETMAAVERSLEKLRAWVAKEPTWEVVDEYFDDLTTDVRDDFRRLLADTENGQLEVVLFTSLNEFLPSGTVATVRYLAELGRNGVKFASRTEAYLSTVGKAGDAIARTLGALEAQERLRFAGHLRSRLADARRAGHGAGRPRLPLKTRVAIARHRREGQSIAATAKALGVAPSTVVKYQYSPVDDLFELLPDRAVRKLTGQPID